MKLARLPLLPPEEALDELSGKYLCLLSLKSMLARNLIQINVCIYYRHTHVVRF